MTADFNKLFVGLEQNVLDTRNRISDTDYDYTITADLFTLTSMKHKLQLNSQVLQNNYIDENLIMDIYNLEIPYQELKSFFSDMQPIKKILITNLDTFVYHILDLGSFNDYLLAQREFDKLKSTEQKATLNANGLKARNFLAREYNLIERYFDIRTEDHPLLYKSIPTTNIMSKLGIVPEKGQMHTYSAAQDIIGGTELFNKYFGDK